MSIPVAAEKTLGPLSVIEFLGITLDSKLLQASRPLNKLLYIPEAMKSAAFICTP